MECIKRVGGGMFGTYDRLSTQIFQTCASVLISVSNTLTGTFVGVMLGYLLLMNYLCPALFSCKRCPVGCIRRRPVYYCTKTKSIAPSSLKALSFTPLLSGLSSDQLVFLAVAESIVRKMLCFAHNMIDLVKKCIVGGFCTFYQ